MGWKETWAVDERMRLMMAAEKQEEAAAALCQQFGVSRAVGYKWLGRYREAGVEGLLDCSRAPCSRWHDPMANPTPAKLNATAFARIRAGGDRGSTLGLKHVVKKDCPANPTRCPRA